MKCLLVRNGNDYALDRAPGGGRVVSSLDDLFALAREMGVKIIAGRPYVVVRHDSPGSSPSASGQIICYPKRPTFLRTWELPGR